MHIIQFLPNLIILTTLFSIVGYSLLPAVDPKRAKGFSCYEAPYIVKSDHAQYCLVAKYNIFVVQLTSGRRCELLKQKQQDPPWLIPRLNPFLRQPCL